ncbi:F-box only protein 42 [Mactra antiquata]
MGNQGSSNECLGERLENDVSVTWKKVTDCQYPTREGQCCCSHGNSMYIFGGVIQANDGHLESNDLIKYNPVDDTWTLIDTKGTTPEPRSAACLVCVGNTLYLFGGLNQESGWLDKLYAFDIDTSTWSELQCEGPKPSARDKLQGTAVDKCIYYFGGFGPKFTGEEEDWEDMDDEDDDDDEIIEEERTQQAAQFGWFNDLYCFNTETKKWTQPMQMNLGVPTARAAHGMTCIDRDLYIFGGRDTEKRTNDLHIFNVDTRKWKTDLQCTGQWPVARSFHTVNCVGKRVIVMGGRGSDNQHLADFHIFDSETNQWLQPKVNGDIPASRGQHSVSIVGDKLILYGGSADFNSEIMMCQKFYGDTFVLPIGDILKGKASEQNSGTNGHDTTNAV